MTNKTLLHFINYNGNVVNEKDTVLEVNNRGLLYGDALFETMHCHGSEVQLFKDHYHRLVTGLKILQMEIPGYFTQHFLHHQVEHLLKRNKLFKGARTRLTVFRNPGGLYTPLSSEFSYIIQNQALEEDHYVLNQKGFVIDLYDEIRKPINLLSNIKTTNALLFVLAGLHKKSNQLDECLILNEKGFVCETISSNIFLAQENVITTPSLKSGCLDGVMRKNIIQLCTENSIKLIEKDNVEIRDIELADEVFITNAIAGIRWVVGYEQKRYFSNMAKKLNALLNQKAFGN